MTPRPGSFDERTFEAWLSLGPDGDRIPTETGRLTRDALLGTTALGADYYRQVFQGTIRTALDRAINHVRMQIQRGETLHAMIAKDLRGAFHGVVGLPTVVGVSNLLGGADFPPETIWDQPHDILNLAVSQNSKGNVKLPSKTVLLAAIMTSIAAPGARRLHRGHQHRGEAGRDSPHCAENRR